MLVPDSEMPGGERVKILDFGIAKGVSEYSGPASEEYRTNTGMVLGTATYMAPEQCKGAGNVTDRADVYSLGVMMYRMCCGQLPFRAEGQGEVMAMHIFSTARPLRDHDASIPQPMADLVARMMSKAPTDRPPMTQVAQELDRMLSSTSVPNQPAVVMIGPASGDISAVSSTLSAALGQSGSMKPVGDPPPRKPRLWLGALATVALVLIGLGVRFGIGRLPAAAVVQRPVVYWDLKSNPPSAQVVRKKDGQELYRTPWMQVPEPGVGRLAVIFRAPGYVDEEVELDETKSFTRLVNLRPEPASPPQPTPQPATPGPSANNPAGGDPGPAPADPNAGDKTGPASNPASVGGTAAPRVPAGPAAGRLGKPPVAPGGRRMPGGQPSGGLLTDDNITILQ